MVACIPVDSTMPSNLPMIWTIYFTKRNWMFIHFPEIKALSFYVLTQQDRPLQPWPTWWLWHTALNFTVRNMKQGKSCASISLSAVYWIMIISYIENNTWMCGNMKFISTSNKKKFPLQKYHQTNAESARIVTCEIIISNRTWRLSFLLVAEKQ